MLAHELGHLKHRDSMRGLIRDGSTSFLIGLLFGDITGSSALIFGSRTLVTSSHSREAETNADGFAIDVMHRLGRPAKPTGELLLRVTGKESKGFHHLHPSPQRGPAGADGPRGPVGQRAAAADIRGMACVEIDLRWQA